MSARRAAAARRSVAARWAAVALALGFAGLGASWTLDRARTWEPPRWTPGRFVPLRGGHVPAAGPRGLVTVAVSTNCPHCLESLAALADSLEPLRAAGRAPRLVALVVDAPERPGAPALARVRARYVAWDSAQVWRRRWGRRLYGDVLRFDPRGRLLRPAAEDRPRDTEGG